MATYAIGDIQGCLDELKQLLRQVKFSSDRDQLWFTGDLVNRGPQSAETLRFVRALGANAITTLGNHDLHAIAIARGYHKGSQKDHMPDLMQSPDRYELLDWLLSQKILHRDDAHACIMVHAGIYPFWSIQQAQQYAKELESVLQGERCDYFLKNMYGSDPRQWDEALVDISRWRFITNAFTRMRFCQSNGELELEYKGAPGSHPQHLPAWYELSGNRFEEYRIIFGHWSTHGPSTQAHIFPVDTGCLWGGRLTALSIDKGFEWHQLDCKARQQVT